MFAVNHAVFERVFKRTANPHEIANFQSQRKIGQPQDVFFQALAIEIFHGDEGDIFRCLVPLVTANSYCGEGY
jgi:hypothetical protein